MVRLPPCPTERPQLGGRRRAVNDLDKATQYVGRQAGGDPGQAREEGNKKLDTIATLLGQILARTAPYAIASPGGA